MKAMLASAAILAAITTAEAAQTREPPDPLVTRRGWEVGGQFADYHYEEPGLMKLTGGRAGVVGAYTFTNAARVFSRIDARTSYGSLKYESTGSGTLEEVPDWIFETRAVSGKDFLLGDRVSLSPYIGLGYRYLYNDLRGYSSTGAGGYRRASRYIYAPVGTTMRIHAGEHWVIAPMIEYDVFLRGRQYSYLSDIGPGFSDVSNRQTKGMGYRAYLMIEKGRWAFGPWMHYWKIKDSEPTVDNFGRVLFEPENWTREYGVELRFRF